MSHTFILDENVLYQAVLGVGQRDDISDLTAADLIHAIYGNCHRIAIDREVKKRYFTKLNTLLQDRKAKLSRGQLPKPGTITPELILNLFFRDIRKLQQEWDSSPKIEREDRYPRKDVPIVRAAVRFRGLLVTDDDKVHETVNAETPEGISAVRPKEALPYAQETTELASEYGEKLAHWRR